MNHGRENVSCVPRVVPTPQQLAVLLFFFFPVILHSVAVTTQAFQTEIIHSSTIPQQ